MGYEKKKWNRNGAGILLSMLVCVLMLAVLPAKQVHAEKQVTVTASSANIRSSADTGSTAVASVLKGAKLSVIEETTGADGKTWYKVWVDADTTGYIRADLAGGSAAASTTTTTTTTTTPKVNTDVTVNTDGVEAVQPVSASVTKDQVRVRADSSTSSSIVTTVKKDVVLTVSGTKAGSAADTWYLVSFMAEGTSTNVTGFIRSDYVTLNGELTRPEETTQPDTEVTPTQPEETTPVEESKAFDVILEEDGLWYLVDNDAGVSYPIEQLLTSAEKNADALVKAQKKLSGQTGAIVVLVILLVVLALGITLLIFRVKELLDETGQDLVSFLLGRESGERMSPSVTRTASRRPENRGNEREGRRTVGTRSAGAGSHAAGSRPAGAGSTGNRPAGAGSTGSRPAGAGSTGSRPAGAGSTGSRPMGTGSTASRSAGAGSTGVRSTGEYGTRPAGERPVRPSGERTVSRPVTSEERLEQQARRDVENRKLEQNNADSKARRARNFMTEDDEFEFEFLNWDGEEEK